MVLDMRLPEDIRRFSRADRLSLCARVTYEMCIFPYLVVAILLPARQSCLVSNVCPEGMDPATSERGLRTGSEWEAVP